MPYATTVISRTREMLRTGFLKQPPVWWSTVEAYPPISTQPIAHVQRSEEDLPPRGLRFPKNVQDIVYPDYDKLRDRFLRDHPWEAVRPQTLVEGRVTRDDYEATGLSGKAWTELRQRTLKPTVDDCIEFAVNLNKAHGLTLDRAYRTAVDQFRSLRARHEIETRFAVFEATAYGATFGPGRIGAGVRAEDDALSKWSGLTSTQLASIVSQDGTAPEELQSDEGDTSSRVPRQLSGLQHLRPITDGTLNAVGHARREPDPQYTGGLSYLAQRHKLEGGKIPKIRAAAELKEPIVSHTNEPVRKVFKEFKRTRLERRGEPARSGTPMSKIRAKRRAMQQAKSGIT